MKKWKMMALICALCCSLSGCGLSFCGIPLGKREPLVFSCGEKNVETQADVETDGGKQTTAETEAKDSTPAEKTADALETAQDGATVDETASAVTTDSSTQSDIPRSDGKININTAGLEELMMLKGVGESRARAIIEYREQHGSFETPEDIMNISGIKEGVFSKIKDQIAVR